MIAMLRLQFIIFSLIGIGFVTRKKGIGAAWPGGKQVERRSAA